MPLNTEGSKCSSMSSSAAAIITLLVIRQYEWKSYRLFVDWLVLQLSRIPHFTTLQKFTKRISGTVLAEQSEYEWKSYRLFVDWLVLQLSRIPHFTTLQKFTKRISGTVLAELMDYIGRLTTKSYLVVKPES